MSSSRKTPAASQDAAPTPGVVTPPGRPVAGRSIAGAGWNTRRTTPQSTPPGRQGAVQGSLFDTPAANTQARLEPVAVTARSKLWLCVDLPNLSLDALFHHDDDDSGAAACAVFEERKGLRRILKANAKARSAGVSAGQSVNAALSLLPDLDLKGRHPGQEEALMRRLAGWAERFTSFVVVEPGHVLLLELSGSERLFGSVDTLRRQIARGLKAQGVSARLAIAPTPLASTWLAKAGREMRVDKMSQLPDRLSRLPLDCLDWPADVSDALKGMGVSSVGDCLRLPRQGFVRRFGAGLLLQLDRAVGRLPDPRENTRRPQRFFADAEFDAEESGSERLLPVCRELLLKLERFLRTRQIRIQQLQFQFFHLQAGATKLTLGRVQAGQDIEHWLELLRIRLERVALPAPAIAVRLYGGRAEQASMRSDALLFDESVTKRDGSIDCLVERLSARMGEVAVHGITAIEEHRPQHAWRRSSLLDETPRCAAVNTFGHWNENDVPGLLHDARRSGHLLLRRPLWMLDCPEALAVSRGQPMYRGPLVLVSGPERLESGWWDQDGIARDYFVARTTTGVHLWIYSDRQARSRSKTGRCWYLHGIFG